MYEEKMHVHQDDFGPFNVDLIPVLSAARVAEVPVWLQPDCLSCAVIY